jgi:thiamine biosynthesis lipoprotein
VSRRDLLRLRRAGETLRVAPSPLDHTPAIDAATPGFGANGDLIRASRPAMGSYFEVRIGAATPGAFALTERALDLIDTLEQQMTIYREDSEVSRINATAHSGPVEVEPGLFGLLERAVEIGTATGGAYDVTAGALSLAWGFVRGPRRVPDADALAEARERTGQHHVRLDPKGRTIQFDRPGIVINLGSIGKGYAIDRAVDTLRDHWWPTSGLVHGGRSSVFALGSPPGQLGGRWQVAIRNPFDPEVPLGIVYLRNRGMGTSGTSFQRFEAGGRVYGHIIDPRTGVPAEGPASVTVLAPTAAEADALSTAFYLLGIEAAATYVAEHPEIGAIIVVDAPDNVDGVAAPAPRIVTLGLTDDDFTRRW